MEIKSLYLRDKMKIGVIGISGKGKSTFLNHLVKEEAAAALNGLIGAKHKEKEVSGKTKNPVRYNIIRNFDNCICKVSQFKDNEFTVQEVDISKVSGLAESNQKCTISIQVAPSTEFKKIMEEYNLNELEFVDTQGLLDSIEEETTVPYEIKECAVLLYLYDDSDQGVRGDYIKKYRNFLNEISDKPLVFLETGLQWQITNENGIFEQPEQKLNELDGLFSKSDEEIRERYTLLTGNHGYRNKETFILSSILSASESSVNFYEVTLSAPLKHYFDQCVRMCAAHAIEAVFMRISGIKETLQSEFNKAKGNFQHDIGFETCYGLLSDVFVDQFQRIDYGSRAKVLRYARRNFDRFKEALLALQNGNIFNANLDKTQYEIHTPYGYHCIYETYQNQEVLDCMQLLLDMYKRYLQRILISGNKLSKAIQVYLAQSISNDFMCRDTGYDIPILSEETFKYCIKELQLWTKGLPISTVVYKNYSKFDVEYCNKQKIIRYSNQYIGSVDSLISKLDYLCMCINNKMYNLAIENILNSAKDFVDM